MMKTSEKISQNMNLQEEITVKNIDHLGLVAGLIDDLVIVEHIAFLTFVRYEF